MGMTTQLLAAYTGQQFIKDLSWIVVIVVSIAGALSTLYAVYIFYLFMTASDPTKRKAAKDRLIKVFSSTIIIVALAGVLAVLDVIFVTQKGSYTGPIAGGNGVREYSSYTMDGDVSCTLSANPKSGGLEITGTFSLFTSMIKGDGAQIDPKGNLTTITDVRVVSPSDWPTPLKFSDKLSVYATTDDKSGGNVTNCKFVIMASGFRPESGGYVTIPVVSQEPNIITVAVKFNYVADASKSYGATCNVKLRTNDSLLRFAKSA
ncbi:MAG: hypothetical protein KIG16_00175 [Eubacteriales bacterium]|nr:hypothetical protein [Eubacteriales bacterium]